MGKLLLSILLFLLVAGCAQEVTVLDRGFYERGIELADQQRYPEAIKEFEKAIAINGTIARYFYNLGYCYFELALYEEALGAYEEAIQLQVNYPEAWYNIALAHDRLGNVEESRMAYEKYLRQSRAAKSARPAPSMAPKEKPKVLYGPNQP